MNGTESMSTEKCTTAPPGVMTARERLISTIEATGGVIAYEDGTFGPVGDPEWIDLGDAYVSACEEAGREPRISNEDSIDRSEVWHG